MVKPRTQRRGVYLVAGVCWIVAAAAADEIAWSHGGSANMHFVGYEKGRLRFMNEQRDLHEADPSAVQRVGLEEPLPMVLELNGGAEPLHVLVKGYGAGGFDIRADGRRLRLPREAVARLEPEWRSARMRALSEVAVVLSRGEETALAGRLARGQPAIVLFHYAARPHSVRMDGYLGRFPLMSRGRIGYYKIEVSEPEAPVARQHRVTRFPTVLFFDAEGREVQRLEGAGANPRAVDEALRRADAEG